MWSTDPAILSSPWYCIHCSTITDNTANLTYWIKFLHTNTTYTVYITDLIYVYSHNIDNEKDIYNEHNKYAPNMLYNNTNDVIKLMQQMLTIHNNSNNKYTIDIQHSNKTCELRVQHIIANTFVVNWLFDCSFIGDNNVQSNFIKQYYILPMYELTKALLYNIDNDNNINNIIHNIDNEQYTNYSKDFNFTTKQQELYKAVTKQSLSTATNTDDVNNNTTNENNNNVENEQLTDEPSHMTDINSILPQHTSRRSESYRSQDYDDINNNTQLQHNNNQHSKPMKKLPSNDSLFNNNSNTTAASQTSLQHAQDNPHSYRQHNNNKTQSSNTLDNNNTQDNVAVSDNDLALQRKHKLEQELASQRKKKPKKFV